MGMPVFPWPHPPYPMQQQASLKSQIVDTLMYLLHSAIKVFFILVERGQGWPIPPWMGMPVSCKYVLFKKRKKGKR